MFGIPSEAILTMVSTVATWWMENKEKQQALEERRFSIMAKQLDLEIRSADATAKRTPIWLRASVSLVVVGSVFGGVLYYAGDAETAITIIKDIPRKSFLGVIKWGKTYEVLELQGLALIPVVTHSLALVMGHIFGKTIGRWRQ